MHRTTTSTILKVAASAIVAAAAANSAAAADWITRHGLNATQYQDFYNNELPAGYRLLSVDVNGPSNDPNFAGVWIQDQYANPGDWDARHGLTSDEYQQYTSDMDAQGFRVVAVAAYGTYPNERYAAAYVKDGTPDTDWAARHRMTEAQLSQEANDLSNQGLTMEFLSAFGSGADTRYSAVWRKNYKGWSKWVRWDMSESEYQDEVNSRAGAGYRVMHFDVWGTNANPRFGAIFVRPDGNQWEHQPHWVARHNQTGQQHQDLADDYVGTDMQPLTALEYGDSNNPKFGSVWVKTHGAPSFKKTGIADPVLTPFDQAMEDFMTSRKIRNGSLAVTYEGRLVLNRGYTYAPSNWPTTQPEDMFRTASVSKLYTAVAIFQLIENNTPTGNGPLTLQSTLGDIGGAVGTGWTDTDIEDITIGQLLTHTAGWENDSDVLPGAFDPMFSDFAIEDDLGINLPTTPADVLDWMKQFNLNYNPGDTYSYSNFGYSILGRVIEQLSGQTYEQYVQSNILCPIGAGDMFVGDSLAQDVDPREVPYVEPMRRFRTSRFGTGELVLWPYGGFNVNTFDAHGGWVASAQDLARFANAFRDKTISPLLTEASINDMWKTNPKKSDKTFGWSQKVGYKYHNGSIPGTWAYTIVRDDGITISVLFNQRSADNNVPLKDNDWEIRNDLLDAADQINNMIVGGAPAWPNVDLWDDGNDCRPKSEKKFDLNGDLVVDGRDLATLLAAWGDCDTSAPCDMDGNGDGRIDGAELAAMLSEWGN
jgi:CubicO group peptidase (beta-lactamase class C family)